MGSDKHPTSHLPIRTNKELLSSADGLHVWRRPYKHISPCLSHPSESLRPPSGLFVVGFLSQELASVGNQTRVSRGAGKTELAECVAMVSPPSQPHAPWAEAWLRRGTAAPCLVKGCDPGHCGLHFPICAPQLNAAKKSCFKKQITVLKCRHCPQGNSRLKQKIVI